MSTRAQMNRELYRECQANKLNRLHWQSDRRRINSLKIPTGAQYVSDCTRVLSFQNEFISAQATFRRRDGIWSCLQCEPSAEWLKKTPFDQIKNELLKRGCSWEWLPVRPPTDSLRPGDKHESFTITSRTAARPVGTSRLQASTPATGGTQGMKKLLDQGGPTTPPNSKCSPVPTQ